VADRAHRATTALLLAAQSTQNLAFSAIALFLPLIREDIPMSFTQAGSLAVAGSLAYTALQVPAGYLADRWGAGRLFVIGALGLNLTSAALGLLDSYPALVVDQFLSGCFRALVFAPGLVLVTARFPAQRRAAALGLYAGAGFLASVVLNLAGPLLVEPLGWRWVFVLFSACGIAVALGFLRSGDLGPRAGAAGPRPTRGDLAVLTRRPILWLASLVQFVRLAVVQGLRFWLPSFLVADKGATLQVAGLVVALAAGVTAPANFMGGYLSDRLGRPRLVIALSLAVLAATFALLPPVGDLGLLVVVIVVQAVFVNAYFGSLFEVPLQHLGQAHAGTVNGFANFWANVGGLTAGWLLGSIKDLTGSFAAGWYGLGVLCLVGLAATGAMGRVRPVTAETP
jgi:nitrate/nitrite transporter NarK